MNIKTKQITKTVRVPQKVTTKSVILTLSEREAYLLALLAGNFGESALRNHLAYSHYDEKTPWGTYTAFTSPLTDEEVKNIHCLWNKIAKELGNSIE